MQIRRSYSCFWCRTKPLDKVRFWRWDVLNPRADRFVLKWDCFASYIRQAILCCSYFQMRQADRELNEILHRCRGLASLFRGAEDLVDIR